MSLQYTITVSKDHAQVTANWDIKVDMSDAELISNFTLTLDGAGMNTQCSGGNKACNGAAYASLSNPTADSPVTFVIATNKPDVRNGSTVLRGEKTYDDVTFSG
ncbi:MAG: hypothetical protein ACRD4A_14570 [Candidatus Acidiferrales bacterium]